jgi:hypothetical protein
MTVFQLDPRHFDCTLMMRDHHGDEVSIYVARRFDKLAIAYVARCRIVVEQEMLLIGIGASGTVMLHSRWILGHGE